MHWLFFWILPWRWMMHKYIFSGPVEKCTSVLKRGDLLQIAVGGAVEMLFSTSNYEVVWGRRTGFAKAARQAGADIIPVFTRNIRQMSWVPWIMQKLMWPVYLVIRQPMVPILPLGFPVKLVTYVGEPIRSTGDESLKELA